MQIVPTRGVSGRMRPDTCANCTNEISVAHPNRVDSSAVRCRAVDDEYGLEPTVTESKHPNAKTDATCAAADDVMPYALFI
mmetsp:Transcript_548/g.788  ORF Transcript_548/g.788 Transcript_548/m.788 type:complete len:81 (-) Transcript_548:469-711(-)